MPRPLFSPGKDPVPIVQEAGCASGPVWTGAENIAPTGIRSPDRSARSQSLYELCYPALELGHNGRGEKCIKGFFWDAWKKETSWTNCIHGNIMLRYVLRE